MLDELEKGKTEPLIRPKCAAEDEHDWDIEYATENDINIVCHKCHEWRSYCREL